MSREMLEIEQLEKGLSCRFGFSFELPMIADGNIMILSQGDGDENEEFPLSMLRFANSVPTMQSLTFSMTRGRFSGGTSANPPGTLLEVMSNDKQQKIPWKLITSTLSSLLSASLEDVNAMHSDRLALLNKDGTGTSLIFRFPDQRVCIEHVEKMLRLSMGSHQQSSIGTLLNVKSAVKSSYLSIGMHIHRTEAMGLKLETWVHVHFPYALGPYGVFSALDFLVPSNNVDHPNGDIEILEKIALLGGSIPDRFDNHAVIMVNGRSLSYPGLISKVAKDDDPVNVSFERYYIPHSLYGGMFSYVIRNDDFVSSRVVSLLDVIPWEIKCWYHTLKIEHPQAPHSQLGLYDVAIHPSKVRTSPSVVEINNLVISPNDTIRITMHADRRFVHYGEFPLDAHRGLEIGFGRCND